MNDKYNRLKEKATIAIAPFWDAILAEAIVQQLESAWLQAEDTEKLLANKEGIGVDVSLNWDPKYRSKVWISLHVNLGEFGVVYLHRRKTTGYLRQLNSCLQHLLQDLLPDGLKISKGQLSVSDIHAPTDEQLRKGIKHLEVAVKKSRYKLSSTASKRFALTALMKSLEKAVLNNWSDIVAELGSDTVATIYVNQVSIEVGLTGNASSKQWANRLYKHQRIYFDVSRPSNMFILDQKTCDRIHKVNKEINIPQLFIDRPEISWRWKDIERTISRPTFHQIAVTVGKKTKKASASRGNSSTKRSKKVKALESSQNSCSLIPENQEKASKPEDLTLHTNYKDGSQGAQQQVQRS